MADLPTTGTIHNLFAPEPDFVANRGENSLYTGYADLAALAGIPSQYLTQPGALANTLDGKRYILQSVGPAVWAEISSAPSGAASGDLGSTYPGPTVVAATGAAGVLPLATTAASVRWATGTTAPTLTQADNTTNGATGQPLAVQAQNATGTTSTGGKAVLSSGTGTTAAGNVELQTGGTARVTVSPTAIAASVPLTVDNATALSTMLTLTSASTTRLAFAYDTASSAGGAAIRFESAPQTKGNVCWPRQYQGITAWTGSGTACFGVISCGVSFSQNLVYVGSVQGGDLCEVLRLECSDTWFIVGGGSNNITGNSISTTHWKASTFTGAVITQAAVHYQGQESLTPTEGGTVTCAANKRVSFVEPAAPRAAATVNLPSTPTDGHVHELVAGANAIAALTLGAVHTIRGALPTSTVAYTPIGRWIFRGLPLNEWWPMP